MQQNSKPSYEFYSTKYDSIDTAIFVCLQIVQESLFMFLLQVKEKEEALESLE
jgi:hypothetical protein